MMVLKPTSFFSPGYWTFKLIASRLADESITLTSNPHNNTCRIFCQEESVQIGLVGELLGFGPNKTVAKNTFVNSKRVDINLGVRGVSISCSLVNST